MLLWRDQEEELGYQLIVTVEETKSRPVVIPTTDE